MEAAARLGLTPEEALGVFAEHCRCPEAFEDALWALRALDSRGLLARRRPKTAAVRLPCGAELCVQADSTDHHKAYELKTAPPDVYTELQLALFSLAYGEVLLIYVDVERRRLCERVYTALDLQARFPRLEEAVCAFAEGGNVYKWAHEVLCENRGVTVLEMSDVSPDACHSY